MPLRIILTGSPSSGKTSITNAIKNSASVFCIPETARLMIVETGVSPKTDSYSFQKALLKYQIAREECLIEAFEGACRKQNINIDDYIYVFDRSCIDGHSYMKDEQWDLLLSELSITEEQLRARYDIVIFLEANTEHYKTDSERNEDPLTSYLLGERLYNIFKKTGLPIYRVPQTDTINEKIFLVKNIVKSLRQCKVKMKK